MYYLKITADKLNNVVFFSHKENDNVWLEQVYNYNIHYEKTKINPYLLWHARIKLCFIIFFNNLSFILLKKIKIKLYDKDKLSIFIVKAKCPPWMHTNTIENHIKNLPQ